MNNKLNNTQQSIIDQEFNKPENEILQFASLFMLVVVVVMAIGLGVIKVEKREKVKVIVERIGDFEFRIPKSDKYEILRKEGNFVSQGMPIVRLVNRHGVDSIIVAPISGKFCTEIALISIGKQKYSQAFVRIGADKPLFKVRVLMDKSIYQKDLSGTKLNFRVNEEKELTSYQLKAALTIREGYCAFSNEQSWVAELDEKSRSFIGKYTWKNNEVRGEGTIVSGTQQLLNQLLSKK